MKNKMATSKNNIAQESIVIKPIEIRTATIRIQGTAPLIMHKWSEKAKKMILDKQTKETKVKGHDLKVPVADFISSAYWITPEPDTAGMNDEECENAFDGAVAGGARWGFPVTAIKQATIMSASRNDIDIKTTTLRGCFFIEGEGPDMLAEVKGCVPHMREDMVRVGGMSKTADIRHRAQFDDWYMDLKVSYNVNGPITLEQLVNLINLGGFTCGIGEWRPEKDGSFGMYRVETNA
jgi:hypothetical protein